MRWGIAILKNADGEVRYVAQQLPYGLRRKKTIWAFTTKAQARAVAKKEQEKVA